MNPQPRFRIGACDWSLGKMSDPGGLEVARRIGLDGLQISLGTVANDMHLRRRDIQEQYLEASKRTGVALASLAIGELNNVPYKKDPRTVEWVSDSIDVCLALGLKNVLLAFFNHGDLRGDAAGKREVIRRLRGVAPKAEKAGVVLGIESWLSAQEEMQMIEAIGSPSVQVWYDVANSTKMGYNIFQEIRWLGREHICEFHMKENGFLLGQGRIDFPRVRVALDDIGYRGWMQIEGAVPPGGRMLPSYILNLKYLKSIFP